jgi:hypothetical protein
MPNYPLKIPRDRYKGRDPGRKSLAHRNNELVDSIERYLNETVKNEQRAGTQERYSYADIATDSGIDEDRIREMFEGISDDWDSYEVRIYRPVSGAKTPIDYCCPRWT